MNLRDVSKSLNGIGDALIKISKELSNAIAKEQTAVVDSHFKAERKKVDSDSELIGKKHIKAFFEEETRKKIVAENPDIEKLKSDEKVVSKVKLDEMKISTPMSSDVLKVMLENKRMEYKIGLLEASLHSHEHLLNQTIANNIK